MLMILMARKKDNPRAWKRLLDAVENENYSLANEIVAENNFWTESRAEAERDDRSSNQPNAIIVQVGDKVFRSMVKATMHLNVSRSALVKAKRDGFIGDLIYNQLGGERFYIDGAEIPYKPNKKFGGGEKVIIGDKAFPSMLKAADYLRVPVEHLYLLKKAGKMRDGTRRALRGRKIIIGDKVF